MNLNLDRLFLADGAMGTQLLQKGFAGCLESLVLTEPQIIQDIHRQYAAVGAQILLTHTFGANRLALNAKGFGGSVEEINTKAVMLIKSVASEFAKPLQIFGSVGPTQLSRDDIQTLDFNILRAVFREQAQTLVEAGVQGLVLETFYNAKELCMALEATQDLAVPVVSSVTLTLQGQLLDGTTLPELVAIWQHYNPTLVGLNCSDTPTLLWPVWQALQSQIQKPFWLKLNAGMPGQMLTPEEFAVQCRPYIKSNLAVIGGCCGTTALHLQALQRDINKIPS